MDGMFDKCSSLKEIMNLSVFKVNGFTVMNRMFSGCSDELKMKVKAQVKNITDEAFV